MNYIDGDNFLTNVFLELLKRNKLEISIENLIKLEYIYLELLDGEHNVLNNSIDNVNKFVKEYEGYLEIIEEDEQTKICISNEEEFFEVLSEEFEQDLNEAKNYRHALKMLINEEKRSA